MPSYLELWHLSPKTNRLSIQREGLRRCSHRLGRLVLYSSTESGLSYLQRHIADHHAIDPSQLDLWGFRCRRRDAYRIYRGVWCVTVDVPAAAVWLVPAHKYEEVNI